jgi:hypothetical protein
MLLVDEFCHFHLQKNAEFVADDTNVFGFETKMILCSCLLRSLTTVMSYPNYTSNPLS